jgi:hypothetical protein
MSDAVKTRQWRLRMIGGPWDGTELTHKTDTPSRMWCFAGLPSGFSEDNAEALCQTELPAIAQRRISRFDYRLTLALESGDKSIALYVFDGPGTRVIAGWR